jgi:transcriptional regulator with XRE-family HTH domain
MLNERLKIILGKLNLSQRQFAAKIDLDPGYFSRIMQGKATPPDRIILLIENIFNINRQWLMEGNGEIFKNEGVSREKKHILEIIDELDDNQVSAVSAFMKYLIDPSPENK